MNKKMGGTVCDLSAPEASPNAIHEEKHEQFTPNIGREPSSACSLVLEFLAIFSGQDTRTKSIYKYIMTSRQRTYVTVLRLIMRHVRQKEVVPLFIFEIF